jgi:O-antigen/teichoic acid export membrane protein
MLRKISLGNRKLKRPFVLDEKEGMTQSWNLKRRLKDLTPRAFEGLWTRLESSPVGERLLRGAFWSVMGTLVARALGLAAAILAARVVGKMVYGELGIIQSTVGMLGTLAGFGMSTTASKFVAELRTKDPARAGRIIALSSLTSWGISLVLAALLIIFSPWLCQHTFVAPQLTGFVRLSAPLLVLGGINGAQLGVLLGFEAFKSIARVNCLTGLLNFPLVVGGALLFGLPGIICGMVLAQACGCLLNLRALQGQAREYKVAISYSSCTAELPILWQFSIPAVLTEIMISAVGWATATMLVRQLNGYSEMGAFSAANQWFNAAFWLPMMIGGVALPMISERLGAEDNHNSIKLLWLSVKINAVVVVPIVVFGCLASPFIMASYGKGFRSAWPTLVAVLMTAGILSLEFPLGQFLSASGRMWLGFSSNLGWGVVFFGANAVLLKWGSLGLASARLLAYSAHAIFIFAYVIIFMTSKRSTAGRPGQPAMLPEMAVDPFAPPELSPPETCGTPR